MEPTEQNRRAWDEVHRRRAGAMADRPGIPEQVKDWLPDLAGRHVLHLQCATGESTAELTARGAFVTGIDVSAEALAVAREQAPTAVFIQADAQALPLELLRGRFDLAYTGGGVLTWLHDLDAWAHGIEGALRHGGHLLLHDVHPAAKCLDANLRWRDDYFDESVVKGERSWRLGQVVTALAQTGLVIRRLEEFSSIHHWQRRDARVPGEFILVARKP